ncbi:MAG: hypothetical protein CML48_03300 [Rhodobacteraceae bacterium]|nr:hypothetical protein [Paracoccaceae bacterium]
MKIGIIGYGFVGKALADGLKDNIDLCIIDPKLDTNLNDLFKFKPEIIFLCLPTPMQTDGTQDISLIKKTLLEITKLSIEGIIVIKSTVHPGNINDIKTICSEFVYNPEFLREKHAKEDFINSELIIFGGNKKLSHLLSDFYKNHTKCINTNYIFTDATTASMIKYTINSFLATKVIFFNEINNIFESTNTKESWENFTKYLSLDKRVGDSHMMVPGHDGRLGFGGACLPKDINALVKYAESNNVELNLIKSVIKTNNKIRASYNSTTDREDEQNINYNNLEEEQ